MSEAETNYEPSDAFGLLRSYSRHRDFVRFAITVVAQGLERRGVVHDASKMSDEEFAGFARINAAARINKFGSPEYAEAMQRERAVIDRHFGRNTHHAEYYVTHPEHQLNHPDCPLACGMGFLDVIEMVCDWWGARKGYDDPRSWMDTVELNFKQKGPMLSAEQLWLARQVAGFLYEEAGR